MKTAEAYPHPADDEQHLSPKEFETLRRAYYVKNHVYIPAIRRLADEGRLDRKVLLRLDDVQRSHIDITREERNETGERFAAADITSGGLSVPHERYVPHEATHLLGGVEWQPLNEGLTQLMTDKITDEMALDAQELYEENKQFAENIARLAGFNLTSGSALEDVNWARLSRLFCGEDREENFLELNSLVRRKTGADTLLAMRELQERSDYLIRARRRVGEAAWEQLKSSERDTLEIREMNQAVEAMLKKESPPKTSRPLGRTASGMWRPDF